MKAATPQNLIAVALLLANACTTSWQETGRYYQTRGTLLAVSSSVPATVYINRQNSGVTPLVAPLEYYEEARKQNRKVSYWITQPGWSLFASLMSLGLYIPFSFIPVDTETRIESTGAFKDNRFAVDLTANGYEDWNQEVVCTGQEHMSVDARLIRPAGSTGQR